MPKSSRKLTSSFSLTFVYLIDFKMLQQIVDPCYDVITPEITTARRKAMPTNWYKMAAIMNRYCEHYGIEEVWVAGVSSDEMNPKEANGYYCFKSDSISIEMGRGEDSSTPLDKTMGNLLNRAKNADDYMKNEKCKDYTKFVKLRQRKLRLSLTVALLSYATKQLTRAPACLPGNAHRALCPLSHRTKTKAVLRDSFPGRLIYRFRDVQWPDRSPDLTATDFFLWSYLMEKSIHHQFSKLGTGENPRCNKRSLTRDTAMLPVINEEASGSQKSGRQIINRRRTFTEEGKSTSEGEYNPEDINVPINETLLCFNRRTEMRRVQRIGQKRVGAPRSDQQQQYGAEGSFTDNYVIADLWYLEGQIMHQINMSHVRGKPMYEYYPQRDLKTKYMQHYLFFKEKFRSEKARCFEHSESNHRSRITNEYLLAELKIATTNINPNFDEIVLLNKGLRGSRTLCHKCSMYQFCETRKEIKKILINTCPYSLEDALVGLRTL
ncbi:hypothetical protein C0J52_19312 [Blattella germanica]|nr:hypothetical protein C0J52_19312 [Blattella germanica]